MDRKTIFVYSSAFLILSSLLSASLYYLHFDEKDSTLKDDKQIAEADSSFEQLKNETSDLENGENTNDDNGKDPTIEFGPSEKTESNEKEGDVVALTDDQIESMGLKMGLLEPKVIALTLARRGQIILHPDGAAQVLTKMSGVTKETKKNLGDYVKAGDVLAILESQSMADAKAEYLASLNKEGLAHINLEREIRLFNKRISPKQDYFNAQALFRETKINTELAKQKLKASGLNEKDIQSLAQGKDLDLRMFEVRAPMDGIVIGRHITKGKLIDEKTLIYEIADLSTVWVEIGIYPQDLAMVKEGQSALVQSPFDTLSNEAKVFYLSPVVENENMLTVAMAELNNVDWKWKPGMFVNVDIAVANVPVNMAVSKHAVQNIEGKNCLFIKGSKGFEKRFVAVGKSDNEFVEILDGVNCNDACVVNNALLLKAEMGKSAIEDDD